MLGKAISGERPDPSVGRPGTDADAPDPRRWRGGQWLPAMASLIVRGALLPSMLTCRHGYWERSLWQLGYTHGMRIYQRRCRRGFETVSWDGPTLLDSFERMGEWWLPGETAEKRVPGKLSFDPEGGVRLETLKPFRKERELELGAGFRPDIVHGFTDYAMPVTLYRVTRVGQVRPPDSDLGSTFYARYAVLGHHFHEVDDVRLASLQVGFTDLEEWAEHHPFVGAMPHPSEPRTGLRKMEPVQVEVGSLGAWLTVKSHIPSWGQVPMKTLRWEHRIVFEIEPEEPKPLGWYRDVLRGLQDLLTLLMGRPTQPSALEAQVHKGQNRHSEVFFDVGIRPPKDSVAATGLSPRAEVLVPRPKIRLEFADVLDNWFSMRELLAPVHGLFFGTLFSPGASPEFQFLSLAQALESYHRRTKSESLHESKEDYREHYEEIMRALPDSLPESLRQSLENTLEYGNEWSLRRRIKDLLGDLPDEGIVDQEHRHFTRTVVGTRNYLTHYPDDFEDEILEGPELREAVDELRRMLAFFLLKDTGISEEKAAAAIAEVPRYGYFYLGE